MTRRSSPARAGAALRAATQKSEKLACRSPMQRAYSARNSAHSERSSLGSPENGGGSVGILALERVAGDDPNPRSSAGGDRRERAQTLSCTITSGASSSKISRQPVVDVASAVEQRLPGRGDEVGELLVGALAKHRRRVADEVLPELAGLLGLGRGGRQAHQPLLESLGLERAGERLLDHEHAPRWPRRRSTSPIPTQLLVGPNAPSGKKTIVWASRCEMARQLTHGRSGASEAMTQMVVGGFGAARAAI